MKSSQSVFNTKASQKKDFSHVRAKKALGQNFLIDQASLHAIAHTINTTGRHIIEVGPGYGALTELLIQTNPLSLDLVELDTDMITILKQRIRDEAWNINIHHQDILTYTPVHEKYCVIANIPYYITSPILFHFLYPRKEQYQCPEEMVIMMQKEVGQKILAGYGKKTQNSSLSLALWSACESIEYIRDVPRVCFQPAPKVDSIVLLFRTKLIRNKVQEQALLSLWKVGFAHPRKTLISNLKGSIYDINTVRHTLVTLGYSEQVRAEAIRREDWIALLP